jgi:cell division septation protein DedD
VGDRSIHSRLRRAFLLVIPAAVASPRLLAQHNSGSPPITTDEPEDVRLPNGKKQRDEILKSDYEQNVKDAQELIGVAKSFEEDLEKDDRFVLSLSSLKKLDDIERLTKRIRGRMKKF